MEQNRRRSRISRMSSISDSDGKYIELTENWEPSGKLTWKKKLFLKWEQIGPFDQNSYFINTWNSIVVFFVFWNAVTIPVRFGFRDLWSSHNESAKTHEAHILFLIVDYIGDIIFWIDILLNFRMTFLDHGLLHSDTKKIAIHYLKGRFTFDLIANVPLDFISFDVRKHALLRIPRLIRLNKAQDYFTRWELHTKHSRSILFFKLIGSILLYLHWMGCFYILIAYHYGFSGAINELGWAPPYDYYDRSFWSLYLYAIHWAIKETSGLGGSIPDPENDVERLYNFLCAITSVIISGYIIGNLVNLIQEINSNTEEFRSKMANLNLYMKNKRLPESLTQKIRDYYKHLWSRQGGVDDTEIMGDLPGRLKTEIYRHINGDIIAKVPYFKDTNQGFINMLVEALRPEIFTPGDVIVREGDVGTEMYFISQGHVEVEVKGKVVAQLGEGSFFGEIAVLFESKRTATIKAKTYVDLYILRKADLDKVLKNFPEQRAIIREMAEERVNKDSLRVVLKTHPLFKDAGQEVWNEIQQWFQGQTIESQRVLYQQGENSDTIYFIARGSMDFLDEEGTILKQIRVGPTSLNVSLEGTFFGYVDFILDRPRSHTCRITSPCTLLCLDRADYEAFLSKFSQDVKATIEKKDLLSSYDSPVPEFPNDTGSTPVDKLKKLLRPAINNASTTNLLQGSGFDMTKSLSAKPTTKSSEKTEEKKDLMWLYKFDQLLKEAKGNIPKGDLVKAMKLLADAMN